MTSAPRGPAGAAGAPAPGAGGAASAAAAPRPAPPAAVGGRRRRIKWVAFAENVNDWMSCHDLTTPVARLRSSTRVGVSGRGVFAPRAPCGCAGVAGAGGAGAGGVTAGGVEGGVPGGVDGVGPGGATAGA